MTTLFLDQLFALRGKTAVVTAGSSGIGQTIATALGRARASVLLVARREAELQQTTKRPRHARRWSTRCCATRAPTRRA